MKRNFDLIRDIMLEIEKNDLLTDSKIFEGDGYSIDEITYNCKLMYEDGLIDDYELQQVSGSESYCQVGQLTGKGNDYVELIGNEKIWQGIQNYKKRGGPLSWNRIEKLVESFMGL